MTRDSALAESTTLDTARAESPTAESERIAVLRSYGVLDTAAEASFDDLTAITAQVCGTPMALVSLVDVDRQWFKARLGVDLCSTSREVSFCKHALAGEGLLIVRDALLDPRFATNPLVLNEPYVRFYAGAPLRTPSGHVLGTLCVLDTVPRDLNVLQYAQLEALSRQVVGQLELRRHAIELRAEVAARKEAEAAHARNRNVLDSVLRHSDALIYAKDLDGRFLLANRALLGLIDRTDGELLGHSDHDVFPALVADSFRRNDATVTTTGERQVFHEQMVHTDGVIHDYQSTKFPLFDEKGEIYAVGGVSTDVSALAQQGREHQEAELRWRALVENSPVPVAVIDTLGRFAYANPLAVALYGATSAEALIGRSSRDVAPPDDFDATVAMFAAVMSGEPISGQPWTMRRLDGRLVNVLVNAVRIEYQGQPAVQLELRDVTEQVRTERALRDSESRWRSLISGSPVGIGLADERGLFVAANAALCTLLGREEQDVIGHSSAEFTYADDLESHRRASELIDGAANGIVRIEKRYVRPDGSLRWAWLTVTHTPGPTGETWTLAHIQDITERKITELAVSASEANLAAVAKVVKRIQTGGDARRTIVDAALELSRGSFAVLLEPSADGESLVVSASSDDQLVDERVPMDTALAPVRAFRTGEPVFVADTAGHPQVRAELADQTGARSVYLVPVSTADAVTAVLVVAWGHQVHNLDDRRAAVVTLLADHAGIALRQATLVRELAALASTDPLTRLPNRRGWDEQLELLLAMARRHGKPLTVAIADLDHFKAFNDEHGHLAGDELLQQFASAGRAVMRSATSSRGGAARSSPWRCRIVRAAKPKVHLTAC